MPCRTESLQRDIMMMHSKTSFKDLLECDTSCFISFDFFYLFIFFFIAKKPQSRTSNEHPACTGGGVKKKEKKRKKVGV